VRDDNILMPMLYIVAVVFRFVFTKMVFSPSLRMYFHHHKENWHIKSMRKAGKKMAFRCKILLVLRRIAFVMFLLNIRDGVFFATFAFTSNVFSNLTSIPGAGIKPVVYYLLSIIGLFFLFWDLVRMLQAAGKIKNTIFFNEPAF
jgi:hypothetical protein